MEDKWELIRIAIDKLPSDKKVYVVGLIMAMANLDPHNEEDNEKAKIMAEKIAEVLDKTIC